MHRPERGAWREEMEGTTGPGQCRSDVVVRLPGQIAHVAPGGERGGDTAGDKTGDGAHRKGEMQNMAASEACTRG